MNTAAFSKRRQLHFAGGTFPRRQSLCRPFNAVIDRVTDQMLKRFSDRVGQRTVDAHVATLDFKLDFFS